MKPVGAYGAILLGIVALVGWLYSLPFPGPGAARAIRLSGAVAVVVQLGGFIALRRVRRERILVAWGALAVIRLLSTIAYAVIAAKVLRIPLFPAVLSLATFFFLSTLIEPLLLRT